MQPVAAQPQGHLPGQDDVVGRSGLISWCASSQAPAVAVGPAVPRTATGGPHVSRSRMARASGGACATSASIASPVAWLAGTDPRSSTNDGPSPAGWGPASRRRRAPRAARRSRARAAAAVHRVSTKGSIALAGRPSSARPAPRRRGRRRRRRPRGPAGGPGPARRRPAERWPGCRRAPRGRSGRRARDGRGPGAGARAPSAQRRCGSACRRRGSARGRSGGTRGRPRALP